VAVGGEGETAAGSALVIFEPLRPFQQGLRILPFRVERKLFVADEAVDPGVGYFDFQGIRSGTQCLGDINLIGRLPGDAAVLPVDFYAGDDLDMAEIETQWRRFFGERRIGELEGFLIGGGAGVVSNKRI
jgi:hypothetical protein